MESDQSRLFLSSSSRRSICSSVMAPGRACSSSMHAAEARSLTSGQRSDCHRCDRQRSLSAVHEDLVPRSIVDDGTLRQERLAGHAPPRIHLSRRSGRDAVFAQLGRYLRETADTFKARVDRPLRSDAAQWPLPSTTARREPERLRSRTASIVAGRKHFCDLHATDEFPS